MFNTVTRIWFWIVISTVTVTVTTMIVTTTATTVIVATITVVMASIIMTRAASPNLSTHFSKHTDCRMLIELA